MNLAGYTRASVGNMLNHYTRHYQDPDQTKYCYRNISIDPTRTALNYQIGGVDNPATLVNEALGIVTTPVRENASVVSDWVVTLPKNPLLEGREREFFEKVYELLAGYVTKGTILGGYVHMDETTPHMHFAFVPLLHTPKTMNDKTRPLRNADGTIKTDKKGTPRYERVRVLDENGNQVYNISLAQSKIFNRLTLQKMHPAMEKHLSEYFGFPVGIELSDDDALGKALSKVEQKDLDAARKKLVEPLEQERAQVEREIEEAYERLEWVRQREQEVDGRNQELRSRTGELQSLVGGICGFDDESRFGKAAIIAQVCEYYERAYRALRETFAQVVENIRQGAVSFFSSITEEALEDPVSIPYAAFVPGRGAPAPTRSLEHDAERTRQVAKALNQQQHARQNPYRSGGAR